MTIPVSSDDATAVFQCQVDAGPWLMCDAPAVFDELEVGTRFLRVRAVDATGNADPTPLVRQVEILNDAPIATLALSAHTGPITLPVVATVTASDPDGDDLTATIDWGDGSVVTGAYPLTLAQRSHSYDTVGSYVVRLRVTDKHDSVTKTDSVRTVPAEPLDARPGDDLVVVEDTPVVLDGSDSRRSSGWTRRAGASETGRPPPSSGASRTPTRPPATTPRRCASHRGRTATRRASTST